MKRKANLWSSVSLLIVAVLAVTAFIRGNAQMWILTGVFATWAIWATVRYLFPFLKEQKRKHSVRKLQKSYKVQAQQSIDFSENTDLIDRVLLRHVNLRISSYLQSAYPDATWEWCEESPENIIVKGGTGRIQLYAVPDFNYADVTFNQNADINCSFLKIVSMAELHKPSGESEPIPQKQNPIDPQVWYEKQGRNVLENLITDLNSRGYHSLTIHDNGDISVKQADTEVSRPAFENVPERTYWTRLVKVLESEGMAATARENGIVVSW